MADRFFEQPILNSPYECPAQHWELGADGQPTNQLVLKRRRAEFITPIPKPKKQRQVKGVQKELILSSLEGLSTDVQQYDPNPVINSVRDQVEAWRQLPNPEDWRVATSTLATSFVSGDPAFFLSDRGGGDSNLVGGSCA